MIRKTFARLNQEVSGLHSAAYLLAGFALLSTLLALVRDRLLAGHFGAGVELDIYYAAFRIPDLLYAIVVSMVSVFVLVPFLSQYEKSDGQKGFIHTILIAFGLLLVVSSSIIFIFADVLIGQLFPELVARGNGAELTLLTRVLLLQPAILGVSSIMSSVVQYHGRYFVYALAPLLYNVGIIIGIVFFLPIFGLVGVGYGVVLGALLHVIVQIPTFYSLGFFVRSDLVKVAEVFKVMMVSLPRTLALSANHITLFVLVGMAANMAEGSISIFTLAFNLQAAPLSIIGASYSTAAFPTLSRLFSSGETTKFVNQLTVATRHIIFWSLPFIALIIVLRAQIVRVVYGSGGFDWSDTRLTAAALALFVVSLAAQGVVLLFVRGYYAAGQTRRPLTLSLLSAGLTITFAKALQYIYTHYEFLRDFFEALTRTVGAGSTSVLILPLAYSLSSIITALLFVGIFLYDFRGSQSTERLSRTLFESIVGAFVIGGVSYLALQALSGDTLIDTRTLLGIFIQGALAGTAGIISWALVLLAIGNKELRTVWIVLRGKLWKKGSTTVMQSDIT